MSLRGLWDAMPHAEANSGVCVVGSGKVTCTFQATRRAPGLAAVRAGILYQSSYEDVNIGQAKWPPCPDALSRPKLLAGLYGGLFGLEECYTSIGTIYALECPADGSNIVDYSGM